MDINLTIVGYSIYLLITFYITIRVGWFFYTNGRVYLEDIFIDNPQMVDPINKILLTGYYLLNLGFATLNILTWENVENYILLIQALSQNIGMICVILGIVHYINMAVTASIAHKQKQSLTTQTK